MPSNRAHTWAMAGAFSFVTVKYGWMSIARSMNRRTASYWVKLFRGWLLMFPPGNESEGTCQAISPATPSASRAAGEDAHILAGAQDHIRQAGAGIASRCSQLSKTSSTLRDCR